LKIAFGCLTCMINKAYELYSVYQPDERKRIAFLQEVMERLSQEDTDSSSAKWYAVMIRMVHEKIGIDDLYKEQKELDNALMLSMENQIEEKVTSSEDPLFTAIQYAFTGNYIDYGALKDVSKEKLLSLIDASHEREIDLECYRLLKEELERAESLVFLTDNAGEVVMDKILIKQILRMNPGLKVTVIVRGMPTLNDVTLKEAMDVELDKIARVVTNGSDIPGTELGHISSEAQNLLAGADLVIAKGMGNFESLSGCGLNVYYMFLCKCEWVSRQFGLPMLKEILIREHDLKDRQFI